MIGDLINILEFPSNLGLRQTGYAAEPGVKKLPDFLKKLNFHEGVDAKKVIRLDSPDYSMLLDIDSQVRNADKIVEYAIEQSRLVTKEIESREFFIAIGGDCSILIGNSLAFRQRGDFGLFFLDGHTDFINPEDSNTHAAAGMDLAIVTGHGHSKLTNILNLTPYFREENVFCVGNREYDEDYEKPVKKSRVTYLPLDSLRKTGIQNTASLFLQMIENHKLDGFFIHFDVDVLHDNIMPAVDSREKGGLLYNELTDLLVPLLISDKAYGIEITILDPDLDSDGEYTRDFVKTMVNIIEAANN